MVAGSRWLAKGKQWWPAGNQVDLVTAGGQWLVALMVGNWWRLEAVAKPMAAVIIPQIFFWGGGGGSCSIEELKGIRMVGINARTF